ncbi:hypothetical protein KM043_005758 [Ampulex compressa]|nr:hypothetical protein KM043_005758 [Ampulex compressa]
MGLLELFVLEDHGEDSTRLNLTPIVQVQNHFPHPLLFLDPSRTLELRSGKEAGDSRSSKGTEKREGTGLPYRPLRSTRLDSIFRIPHPGKQLAHRASLLPRTQGATEEVEEEKEEEEGEKLKRERTDDILRFHGNPEWKEGALVGPSLPLIVPRHQALGRSGLSQPGLIQALPLRCAKGGARGKTI